MTLPLTGVSNTTAEVQEADMGPILGIFRPSFSIRHGLRLGSQEKDSFH